MSYDWISDKRNMTGATSRTAGDACLLRAPEVTLYFN